MGVVYVVSGIAKVPLLVSSASSASSAPHAPPVLSAIAIHVHTHADVWLPALPACVWWCVCAQDDPGRHVVRLVGREQLDAARAGLAPGASLHIHRRGTARPSAACAAPFSKTLYIRPPPPLVHPPPPHAHHLAHTHMCSLPRDPCCNNTARVRTVCYQQSPTL